MSNAEHYRQLNSMVDTAVTATLPGEILFDVDGIPTAVEPSLTTGAAVFSVHVTRDELTAAGLTPADVPNLTVTDNEGEQHHD